MVTQTGGADSLLNCVYFLTTVNDLILCKQQVNMAFANILKIQTYPKKMKPKHVQVTTLSIILVSFINSTASCVASTMT